MPKSNIIEVDEPVCHGGGVDNSRGIWGEGNPLDYSIPVLMIQMILYFIISNSIHFLLRPLKQSKFVSKMLGGIILGPSFLGRNTTFRTFVFPRNEALVVINIMGTLGIIYFTFLVTVKKNTAQILKLGRNAICIGTASLFVPCLMVSVTIILLHNYLKKFSGFLFFFLSASVSMTSFNVLVYELNEFNLLTSELGQLAMVSALINDCIGYLFLLPVVFIKGSTKNSLGALISLFILVAFIIYVIRPGILWIIKQTPEGEPVAETYTVGILVLVLVLATVSDAIGATIICGPLVLGLVIPDGLPLGATLVERTEFLVWDFLLPFFFIGIGISTDIFMIQDWKTSFALQCILLVGYIGKLLGTLLSSLYCRMSFRHAISISLIMEFKGMIEMIEYSYWVAHKLVDFETLSTLVMSNMALMIIIVPLMTTLFKPPRTTDGSLIYSHRTIRDLPQDTEFRILSCIHNDDNVHAVITLLEASNPTNDSPICAYVLHLVELIGRAAPLLISHTEYKESLSMTSNFRPNHIVTAFNNYSCNTNGRVSVQPFTMIAPLKNMQEAVYKLAHEKLIPFIIIPYSSMNQDSHGVKATSLRALNDRVLANAPCTVGILVDRGRPPRMNDADFSYNVAVIFLGGKDDREVLAYGTRMCGHPGVKVTVLRFLLDDDDKDNEERHLNDASMNEFKLKIIYNNRAMYKEVVVQDGLEAMNAIGCLENDYDLVMVGRQRSTSSSLHKGEKEWSTESLELGVIGDLLASTEFMENTYSVLVIQQFHGAEEETLKKPMSSFPHVGRFNDFTPLMRNC